MTSHGRFRVKIFGKNPRDGGRNFETYKNCPSYLGVNVSNSVSPDLCIFSALSVWEGNTLRGVGCRDVI